MPMNGRVNDPNGRIALGPAPAPGDTMYESPPGTFDQPGRYLVICNVTRHFTNDDMYGWVIVQ